jgi:hypothetical protein
MQSRGSGRADVIASLRGPSTTRIALTPHIALGGGPVRFRIRKWLVTASVLLVIGVMLPGAASSKGGSKYPRACQTKVDQLDHRAFCTFVLKAGWDGGRFLVYAHSIQYFVGFLPDTCRSGGVPSVGIRKVALHGDTFSGTQSGLSVTGHLSGRHASGSVVWAGRALSCPPYSGTWNADSGATQGGRGGR